MVGKIIRKHTVFLQVDLVLKDHWCEFVWYLAGMEFRLPLFGSTLLQSYITLQVIQVNG